MKLINEVTKEKLRGGFYTPPKIARFINNWVFEGNKKKLKILEPSCGDGSFLRELIPFENKIEHVEAIEFDIKEGKKASKVSLTNLNVENADFLEYYIDRNTSEKFDAVIGNPPYIRYQFLDQNQKKLSNQILEENGVKHSKLMNAWVTFVIASVNILKVGGKVGFVLPAELLQVGYASTVREYLSKELKDILIITFEQLVFKEIQQEVVILLGTKNSSTDAKSHTINHIELKNEDDLAKKELLDKSQTENKRILSFTDKWTYYFLNHKEIDLLDKTKDLEGIYKLKELADVEVGITTGANKFFTITKETKDRYGLDKYAYPLVGRSVQVRGVIYDHEEFEINIQKNNRTYLLDFSNYEEKNNDIESYLQKGLEEKINEGYKCKIRDKWYVVPSVWSPDAFILRRNNEYPKFVVNKINAFSTDTMHRVRVQKQINRDALAVSFYNSMSFAFAEIFGRSYGGGVLEILPSEAESIFMVYRESNKQYIKFLDSMLKEDRPIRDILDIFDQKLLIDTNILSSEQVKLYRSIWEKLSSRRITRGKNQ